MSSDNEIVKMKGSKPPPPVPPRPSKTLIKEALAKTREAHGIYLTRVPKNNNYEKISPRQSPEHFEINASRHRLCERQRELRNGSTRPVVYQSQNCKSPEKTKPSEIEINRTKNNDSIKATNYFPTNITNTDLHRPSDIQELSKLEDEANRDTIKTDADHSDRKTEAIINGTDSGTKVALDEETSSATTDGSTSPDCTKIDHSPNKHWDEEILNNRNHVNTLIDEMFASVLEVNLSSSITPSSSTESIIKDSECNRITITNPNSLSSNKSNPDVDNLTVIVVNDTKIPDKCIIIEPSETKKCDQTTFERKVKFNDRRNHEYLINELQNMKNNESSKTQRHSPMYSDDDVIFHDSDKIHMNDWFGVNEGKKVRMSSCQIKIDDSCGDNERINPGYLKMKNMLGDYDLPPLPKSLSGFKYMDFSQATEKRSYMQNNKTSSLEFFNAKEVPDDEINNKQNTNLDRQLALLRREMDNLREQDLFLLSKLWFLNESIQDFRQILQDQEEKNNLILAPSPSPTPSSIEDDEFYVISTSTC